MKRIRVRSGADRAGETWDAKLDRRARELLAAPKAIASTLEKSDEPKLSPLFAVRGKPPAKNRKKR